MKLVSDGKINADGIISSNEMITEKEGYGAMLYMLKAYWEATESNDLTDILSGGEYWLEENRPADSAFWEYWLEAVEKVKKEGPPPLKRVIVEKRALGIVKRKIQNMEQVLVEINDPAVFIDVFENSSFEKRIELLEDDSWRSNKKIVNYLSGKVEQFNPTSNEWYNVLIIELVGDLGLFSKNILTKLSEILTGSHHYLIKLAVLDSITNINVKNSEIEELRVACQKLIRSKRDRLIVRVQTILISKYLKWERQRTDDLLISYVSKSNDYRLHLRLYEFLLDVGFNIIEKSILDRLVKLSKGKELGKALEKTLLEVEQGTI